MVKSSAITILRTGADADFDGGALFGCAAWPARIEAAMIGVSAAGAFIFGDELEGNPLMVGIKRARFRFAAKMKMFSSSARILNLG